MNVIDYYFDMSYEERDAFMARFADFRCWVEENNEGDDLWVQGHPGMTEEFVKAGVPFTEIDSDDTNDYIYSHSFVNGVHTETEEVVCHS